MSIRDKIDEVLSSLEQEVLAAYLDGESYQRSQKTWAGT
jgi:hypothetical protein